MNAPLVAPLNGDISGALLFLDELRHSYNTMLINSGTNPRKTIHGLLWAMCQPRTFYLLGAGASAGLVPVTQKMRHIIESEYHTVGIYPTTPSPPSPLFERVIGDISPYEQDEQNILLTYIPPAALDFLAQRALWIPHTEDKDVPLQYKVFEVVGSSATLCNFNLDGLASLHCSDRHAVIEMHGRIDLARFERANYKELLEMAVTYETRIPYLSPKLLPQPEPINIVSNPNFARALQRFPLARAVIILGYSFGQRSDSLDDQQSFEFFVSLMKRHPRPVFVVSLTPHNLAEMLSYRLSSDDVYGVPLRWEQFSKAVLENVSPIQGHRSDRLDKKFDSVFLSYVNALDSM